MTLKYCQSHKCHTYDTKDRKRGSKDNRTNQTRRRSSFYYGGGNFCSLIVMMIGLGILWIEPLTKCLVGLPSHIF
jgi:hypothetical protein